MSARYIIYLQRDAAGRKLSDRAMKQSCIRNVWINKRDDELTATCGDDLRVLRRMRLHFVGFSSDGFALGGVEELGGGRLRYQEWWCIPQQGDKP